MLIEIKSIEEVKQYLDVLPKVVIDELMLGGYSIVAETSEDIPALGILLDCENRHPEWSNRLGNSGYLSALYVINNEFTIKLIIPEIIAPKIIKESLED